MVDAFGETRISVRAGEGALEVSEHAAKRMWQRGVSIDVVSEVVGTQQPFQHSHRGVWKTGFYDPATKVFVGSVRGKITTVIDNASERYIRTLQAARSTP